MRSLTKGTRSKSRGKFITLARKRTLAGSQKFPILLAAKLELQRFSEQQQLSGYLLVPLRPLLINGASGGCLDFQPAAGVGYAPSFRSVRDLIEKVGHRRFKVIPVVASRVASRPLGGA
jgi:hypothetical protein